MKSPAVDNEKYLPCSAMHMQTMTISPAEELLGSPRRVVAEAVRGGDDEAVVDEAPAAPALLRAHLDPRHPRPHVDGVIPLHYLQIIK